MSITILLVYHYMTLMDMVSLTENCGPKWYPTPTLTNRFFKFILVLRAFLISPGVFDGMWLQDYYSLYYELSGLYSLASRGVKFVRYLQQAAARCTHKRPNRHVDISRSPLVAVKTLFIVCQCHHFTQHFEVLLILLSFARRHFGRSKRSVLSGNCRDVT